MRKLLFLLLLPLMAISQVVPPDATPLENIQITNNIQSTTATNASVQESNGVLNRIPINALPITLTPVNYSIPNNQIISHLSGIDTRLGQISSTSAGITQRVYFTADNTTVTAGTFFASSLTGKGSTATGSPPALVLADNTKAYFTKDVISIAQPAATIGYAGTYSGNLTVSASPTPVATQQRFTIEIYRTDNGGTPIASGVSGAPVGDLGVTVVTILDSGVLNLTAGAITNVPVSGILTQNITFNTGERLRYHVSAAKIGTGGGSVTFGVYYGSSYNSYYDVAVAVTTDAVVNKSTVTGVTSTDALNSLNSGIENKENRGYLENKQNLRDFYNNLYSYYLSPATTQIGISAWGDSVSPETWRPFTLGLFSRYQQAAITYPLAAAGFAFSPFVSSSGTIFDSETAAINQSVYDGTGGFADFTYLPNANHKELFNGAVLTFGSGLSSGNTIARAYFATGPGMGSVLVELLDETGTTVLNSTTINLSGASLGATKAEFTISKALRYMIRMTATNKVVFLIGGFFKPNGIIPIHFGRGGSTLSQNNYSNKTILNYLMSEFKISLMFLQCKEENINVSLPATITTFNTFSTTSKIIVGSAPDNSSESTQIANNSLFRSYALANDMAYYDAYKLLKNFTEVQRLGWNADMTHINEKGQFYMGNRLRNEMDFLTQINYVERNSIDHMSNQNYVSTNVLRLPKGDTSGDAVDIISQSGTPSQGAVEVKNVRRLKFGDDTAEGVVVINQSANEIALFNRAINTRTNLRAGRVQAQSLRFDLPIMSTVNYKIVTRLDSTGDLEYLPPDFYEKVKAKYYTSLISQSSTSAPTATALDNTLGGTVVWTRTGVGTYVGTLSGAFTANKTVSFFQFSNSTPGMTYTSAVSNASANTINLAIFANGIASDGFSGFLKTEVYP